MKSGSVATTDRILLEIERENTAIVGAETASAETGSIDKTGTLEDSRVGEGPEVEQDDFPQPAGGTLCPNCESVEDWGGGSWCPACGYHPALNRSVEAAIAEAPEPEAGPANLWEAIPRWLWVLLGGIVAIVALSIAVRVWVVGEDAASRAAWALVQAALAEFVSLSVHVLAYLYASEKSDRISPFDVLLKPIAIWKPTFATLPRYAWRVWTFAWSQTALLSALLIIGGLSYSALFDDWGAKKRASMNMTQAIAEQARQNSSGEDSLEENAAQASASTTSATPPVGPPADDAESENSPVAEESSSPDNVLPTVECLIIGYRKDKQEQPTSLLLATAVGPRMQYVGMISIVGIPREEMDELRQRLPDLEQSRSFVKCPYPAVWLRPVLMCEVEFDDWTKTARLKRPKFKQMLGDVQLR